MFEIGIMERNNADKYLYKWQVVVRFCRNYSFVKFETREEAVNFANNLVKMLDGLGLDWCKFGEKK